MAEEIVRGAGSIVKGLATTLREMIQKPVTVQFPEERRLPVLRVRGRHHLHRYEDGHERCVGCLLCQGACPADAIYIEAAENTPDEIHSPGERYAKVFNIDLIRCIFCGYCEAVCPTNAITLESNTAIAAYRREDMILDKQRLLDPVGVATRGSAPAWEPQMPAEAVGILPNTKGKFDGQVATATAVGQGLAKTRVIETEAQISRSEEA